ncbi:MAG: PAS domain-containing sensor histidine kinase [Porticoccaceae bacterium]|nr:PAS domain-containing sensor histidine kinase [Pseudomonadota bacterium]
MEPDKIYFTQDALSARTLRFFLVYRLILALLLWGAFYLRVAPDIFGSANPGTYLYTAIIYPIATVLDLLTCRRQAYRPGVAHMVLILLVDICAHTLLMNASGGLGSGIGYLMLVTVAAGSFFFTGQLAILVAAIASIAIIIESASTVFTAGQQSSTLFPAGVLGMLLFITAMIFQGLNRALRRAEQVASQESEQSAQLQQLNELIISRMLTGILVVDGGGTIELINQAAVQLLGGNSGTPFRRGDNLRKEPGLFRQLQRWQQTPLSRPKPFIPQQGNTEVQASFKPLDQSGHPRTMIFLEDFRAATQQAQQLKMASLGRLTGSIAHEIRNPLGAISHASQLLAEFRDGDAATARLTEIIAKQTRRVNQIVENVLQLSRRHNHSFERIDLVRWLPQFVADYRETSPRHPRVELRFEAEEISTSFDPSHLQQVLGNLLDNAVRYSLQHSGEPWAGLRAGLGGIDRLPVLDILDRGPGVAEKDRGKLFEPFFTTSGEGTGLGLYIARELCEINYATLKYQPPTATEPGFFRIGFVHPGKILERSDHE